MKFPNLGKEWDSRFTEIAAKGQFEVFRTAYMAKVQPDLEDLEARLLELKEAEATKIDAVVENKRKFGAMSGDIVENGTSDEKLASVKILYAKLAESEGDEKAAQVLVEDHQLEIERKMSGSTDPETIEWMRNLEFIDNSNKASKAAFHIELDERFAARDDEWWNVVRRGANRKSKWLARSICELFVYFDEFFAEGELSLLFGVIHPNHNTNLAVEKLVLARILKETTDSRGSTVYALVDNLQMHIRYEADATVEKSIGTDLEQLYQDGNDIIQARKERKLDSNHINLDADSDDEWVGEDEDDDED